MSEFPALNVYIQYGYTVYCVYMYANVRKLAFEHEDSTLQKLQVVQKCEGALFLLKRIFIRKVKLVNCSYQDQHNVCTVWVQVVGSLLNTNRYKLLEPGPILDWAGLQMGVAEKGFEALQKSDL